VTCSEVVRGTGTGEGGRRARGVEEAEAKGGGVLAAVAAAAPAGEFGSLAAA